MRTNAFIFSLIALAAPAWAVIDDSALGWQDLNGESKTGRWYTILDVDKAPYVGAFKNGTIVSSDILWGHGGTLPSDGSAARTLHIGDGATHVLKHLWSGSGGVSVEVCIHDGGKFELAGNGSYIGTRGHLQIMVHSGGTLLYGSTRVPNLAEVNNNGNWFDVSGRAEFPYGIRMANNVKKEHVFYQRSGSSVLFGGDVDYNGSLNDYFRYVIEGGTLQITDQCAFKIPAGKGEIAAGAEAAIDVAEGVVFDFSPFTVWGEGALLTKCGPGALDVGNILKPAIHLADGSLVLSDEEAQYDFSQMSAVAGKVVVFRSKYIVNSISDEFLESAAFSLDTSEFSDGDVIFESEDDSLLDAVKSKFEDFGIPSAWRITKQEGALVLVSNCIFTGNGGASDWNDASGWLTGSVPKGAPVFIKGEGVVCEIKEAIDAVSSITVSDGATLKVSCAIDLPCMNLLADGNVVFLRGADVKIQEISFGISAQSQLPVFKVEKGGSVSVPGGSVFHDAKVHLYGTLSTYGDGDLVIGGSSATSKDKAWYDFICDGATINVKNGAFRLHYRSNNQWVEPWIYDNKTSSDSNANKHKFVLKDTVFVLAEGCGMSFGQNACNWNPNYGETFDGTILSSSGEVYFGHANPDTKDYHKFINGAGIGLKEGAPPSTSSIKLGFRNPELVLDGPGCFINVDTIDLSADAKGNNSSGNKIYVRNSSWIRARVVKGNGNGHFVFGDGVYEVGAAKDGESALFASCEKYGVLIEENGICRIRAVNDTQAPADRAVTIAAAPMSGAGSLAIENNMGGEFNFSAMLTSGGNTATGTASADKSSRLLFADGANWAGTVVSKGNVGFGGDSPATVSMNALQVDEGTLPIRVFVSEDSVVCDCVNVGEGGLKFAEGTGLSLEIPGGIASVPAASRLVVATAPLGTEVPDVRIDGFGKLKVENDPSDASRILLVAVRALHGLSVIVR